jgi:hypothetical protein
MKNIHLISTDKPSRLIYNDANQLCYQSNKSYKNDRKWMHRKKFNIYITSDEEIKDGYWFYNTFNDNQPKLQKRKGDWRTCFNQHKIILTTDQDLIKDGVQAIDDEFLEWFVKNSSCEEVEVLTDAYTMQEIFELKLQNGVFKYKIIIPQEEPKQETLENLKNQLKKVIKEHPICVNEDTYWRGVKIGLETAIEVVKLQEQDKNKYSEEDLEVAYFEGREGLYSFNDWIKQFKKK